MASSTRYRCGFSSIQFGNCFRENTLALGQGLVLGDHVFNVEEVVESNKREIFGRCLPQVKTNDTPYKLSIILGKNRSISDFLCNCPAGSGTAASSDGCRNACKHIAALAIYINSEREESKTDADCEWRAPSSKAKELYGNKGKPITEIFGLPETPAHDWSKRPSLENKLKLATLMEKHGLTKTPMYEICKLEVRKWLGKPYGVV